MADNYLEKQMEALRSGKLTIKAKPGIKPGAKRILIAGGCRGVGLEKALEYRKHGHRVAIFDEDEAAGKRLAHDHGIRFTPVSLSDTLILTRELHSLLTAWRGLNILIVTSEHCGLIEKIIRDWKKSLPIPDNSSLEIISIQVSDSQRP